MGEANRGSAKLARSLIAFALAAALAAAPALVEAQDNPAAPAAPATTNANAGEQPAAAQTFTRAELEKLLAPIALYPDPLLAQLLPASAYPVQIVQAHRWLDKNQALVANNDYSGIDNQNWDPAVKALARFPDVVKMMSADLDWTTDLGDAEVNQPQDVADVIQELRAKAQQNGVLKTTDATDGRDHPADRSRPRAGEALKSLTSKSSRPIRRRSMSPPTTPSPSISPIPASRLSWASGPASRSGRCGTTITGTGGRARSIRRAGPAIQAGVRPMPAGGPASPSARAAGAAISTMATSISGIASTLATTSSLGGPMQTTGPGWAASRASARTAPAVQAVRADRGGGPGGIGGPGRPGGPGGIGGPLLAPSADLAGSVAQASPAASADRGNWWSRQAWRRRRTRRNRRSRRRRLGGPGPAVRRPGGGQDGQSPGGSPRRRPRPRPATRPASRPSISRPGSSAMGGVRMGGANAAFANRGAASRGTRGRRRSRRMRGGGGGGMAAAGRRRRRRRRRGGGGGAASLRYAPQARYRAARAARRRPRLLSLRL